MYGEGGCAYVYLCYGIHYLFNVVTNVVEVPHAVLVRAVDPIEGMELIQSRRKVLRANRHWMTGPGKVTMGLGIDLSHNGNDLCRSDIGLFEPSARTEFKIKRSARIGVDYAEEDALLPYRFQMLK